MSLELISSASTILSLGVNYLYQFFPESIVKIYEGVEGQIKAAIERGDFDNLPNKGKPLDLSGWLKTPEHLRMSYSILKNAGYKPSEVHTKKEMARLRDMIMEIGTPTIVKNMVLPRDFQKRASLKTFT